MFLLFKSINSAKWLTLLIIMGLLFFLFTFHLQAEDQAEDQGEDIGPVFTEEVEVVGNVPVIQAIQSVSVYKNEEMEKFNFENLKSLLQLTPGLLTLSTGQFGQSTSTSIRGSKSTQVLYVVDGIKFRDGASIGGVNLAVLSPNIIDKVEIVRGPLSNIYGSDAMGGVISMNTFAREGAFFTASFGSHGSYLGNFSGSHQLDNFSLGLSVNTQRYSDNVQNDLFKNTGFAVKAMYKNDKINTGIRLFGNLSDSGIPYNYGLATPDRQYKRNYFIFALPFTYTIDDLSKMDVKLAYTRSRYQFQDPQDVFSPYYNSQFDNLEAEVTYYGKLFQVLDLRAGIDYSDQTILNEDNSGKQLDGVKRNYFSAFTSTGWNLGALQLTASVRYDKYKDVKANVSPQLGVSYLIANKFKLRAAYSQSFMAPMISQQVNPWGRSNFDLKPEQGKSVEVGAEYYSGKLVLSAAYFNTKYDDLIDWVTVDPVTYEGQYLNISKVDTYGIEFSATLRPVTSLTLTGAYSYLHTEDKETGEPLKRKPKHTFSAFAAYAHKRFTLSLDMVYVGKRPDLDYSSWPYDMESPSFNRFNISLMVPVLRGLTVFAKMTNAFDKEYQEIVGYPAPGRRFEVGLKYKLTDN